MKTFKEYMNKIHIKKSPTADTRTCDFTTVSKDTLLKSSVQHIEDVKKGIDMFKSMLDNASKLHDHDKISNIDSFHSDFLSGFRKTEWWENHVKVNRHHLQTPNGVRDDVNLIDVIEMLTDCVMAGKARSGYVREVEISSDVLMKAFKNTVDIIEKCVIVDK